VNFDLSFSLGGPEKRTINVGKQWMQYGSAPQKFGDGSGNNR
jgi:hypothetical protein